MIMDEYRDHGFWIDRKKLRSELLALKAVEIVAGSIRAASRQARSGPWPRRPTNRDDKVQAFVASLLNGGVAKFVLNRLSPCLSSIRRRLFAILIPSITLQFGQLTTTELSARFS
jgi:hypothetical protein